MVKLFGGCLGVMFLGLANVSAFVIDIDYTYGGSFFENQAARTAFEKAAFDVQNVITSSFESVPTDTYVGEFGLNPADPARVTIEWAFAFENPSAGNVNVLESFPSGIAPNTFRLFVGAKTFPPDAPELGEGGPTGIARGITTENALVEEFPQALANAVASSNEGMTRGAGPVIVSSQGQLEFEGVTADFSLQVGALAGAVSMNSETNWHFDLNTMPANDQFDFYSVALHEILHTLGIGASETWDSLVDGQNWLGSEVAELFGTGIGMIDEGGSHIAEGKISTSIETGLDQEAAMDPTINAGTRKGLTELDLAFLRDIGYETIAVPEPGTVALLALGGMAVFVAASRRWKGREESSR